MADQIDAIVDPAMLRLQAEKCYEIARALAPSDKTQSLMRRRNALIALAERIEDEARSPGGTQ
jgi:hypothetical protein